MSARGRCVIVVSVAVGAAGCTTASSIALGPALTLEDRARPAIAGDIAYGEGSSHDEGASATTWNARARVIASTAQQSIGGTMGPLLWVGGHEAFTPVARASVEGGFGVEHAHDAMFVDAIGAVRIGAGFVLDAHEQRTLPFFGELPEAMPAEFLRHPERRPQWFARTRTLVTLDLLGEADARFTRAPLGVLGVQIGVAWTRETFVRAPPRLPFGAEDAP